MKLKDSLKKRVIGPLIKRASALLELFAEAIFLVNLVKKWCF